MWYSNSAAVAISFGGFSSFISSVYFCTRATFYFNCSEIFVRKYDVRG